MAVRMNTQYNSAIEVSNWLEDQDIIEEVLYPPLKSSHSHENWEKNFTGGGSLMSIILKKEYSDKELSSMLDHMELFAMGYSWGGFESLITPCRLQKDRISDIGRFKNTFMRLHIGLEDVSDLIHDLDTGLKRLKNK